MRSTASAKSRAGTARAAGVGVVGAGTQAQSTNATVVKYLRISGRTRASARGWECGACCSCAATQKLGVHSLCRDVRQHVLQHDGGVPFEPGELGALHGRVLEGYSELLIRHR